MPVKIARSAPRPSSGYSKRWLATHTSRQSCSKAGKARIFTSVREPSGELLGRVLIKSGPMSASVRQNFRA